MTTRHSGRHRAAVRPRTPLTAISDAVATNASTVTRCSAVLAVSSSLLVVFGLQAATATQAGDPTPEPAAAQTTPGVDVAGTPPDPERRAEPVSRSAERTAPASPAAPDRPPVPAAPAEAAPETPAGGSVLSVAARYVGTPYVYGGTTPAGFDCSGFVQYVYEQVGVSLPRTAAQQQEAGRIVPRSQAQPGDIVSFVGAGGAYHNGVYAGGNEMYDAPRSGKSISKREIWSADVTFTRVG